MADNRVAGRFAILLHADVAGSTSLVQRDEHLAHERIQAAFRRFGDTIARYHGRVRELRGDALLAEFERASDAVTAALAFQADQDKYNAHTEDDIRPTVRVGIAMGEVVFADRTVTGAGVVLAQRMEQLAEPGGVCITAAIHESLPQRMPFEQQSLGEREVKGFDEPVRAYSVRLQEGVEPPDPAGLSRERHPPWVRWAMTAAVVIVICGGGLLAWYQFSAPEFEPVNPEATALRLADTPSIAVLPFDNLSDDTTQEYFAHGITEDITTDLSRIAGLFVIARNSAFTYEDKAIDPKEVSLELGVRYLLEGSVRRVGDLLRINVQLIDGSTGGHLWANRYDGEAEDILAFQNSVIKSVVSSLSLKLDADQEKELIEPETTDPKAYDAFLQGWAHYILRTPEDYAKAAKHFKRAISLDSEYSRAYAALASTYWEGWERWWYKQLGFDEWIGPRRAAEHYLEIALKKPTALAHQVASEVRRQENRHADMIREAETAVRLDPNDPNSYVALTWAYALNGDGKDALTAIEKAIALDPHYPAFYLYLKGFAYFVLKRYGQAAEFLERSLERNPANFSARNILIPTYAYLGEIDKAKKQLAEHPLPLSIDWIRYYWRFKHQEDWDHLADGLRLAGVPEVATKMPTPPKD